MRNVQVGGRSTVRLGPWRGVPGVAAVSTYLDQPLDATAVAEVIGRLRSQGFHRAVTAALTPAEELSFRANGFEPLRELVLLRRPLDRPVPRAEHRLRRWRRRRMDVLLELDRAAFDEFWRLDDVGLREALHATPHRLLRVTADVPPLGYALSGVARDRGYLQRLAVHPDAAGRGVGTSLVLDALRWMRWRGADAAYVNTQHDNDRALRLYEHLGFTPEPEGLVILSREL